MHETQQSVWLLGSVNSIVATKVRLNRVLGCLIGDDLPPIGTETGEAAAELAFRNSSQHLVT